MVETVTKTSKMAGAYSSLASSGSAKLTSDAKKVVCQGPGLSKALVGQKNTFNVDCSKAGEMTPIQENTYTVSHTHTHTHIQPFTHTHTHTHTQNIVFMHATYLWAPK